jgi:hypothetical protein
VGETVAVGETLKVGKTRKLGELVKLGKQVGLNKDVGEKLRGSGGATPFRKPSLYPLSYEGVMVN